jgi:hypothetical protein
MKGLDKLQKKLDIKTWLPDYKINKWIFRGALILIVIIAIVSWALLGFSSPSKNYIYVSCPEDVLGYCVNPFFDLCNPEGELFYTNDNVCVGMPENFYSMETMQGGESIGEKPHWFASASIDFAGLILLLSFVLNHLLYNKKYKFGGNKK